MTKSETRELANIAMYHKLGMMDTVARALSALIRATRSKTTRDELMTDAASFGVANHPDFIV
jgi:hypothetical protein